MLSRRSFILNGLIAAPVVVAVSSLMPLKGVKFDPIVRIQSYPLGATPVGEWWTHRGRQSRALEIEAEMKRQFGTVYWETIDNHVPWDAGTSHEMIRDAQVPSVNFMQGDGSQFGFRPTEAEKLPFWRSVEYPKSKRIPTEVLQAELARVCKWGA